MKFVIYICCFFLSVTAFSQNDEALAKNYFDRGEFEKALISYQNLYQEKKNNLNYFFRIIEIHQQLEKYDLAELLLKEKISGQRDGQFLVELGYNFQLKGNQEEAEKYYNQAISQIEIEPLFAYFVARRFEIHSLIDEAAIVYEKAMELRPESNFHRQLARIYGEQGKVDKMFNSYVNFIEVSPTFVHQAKRLFSEYITENGDDVNNEHLRKALLRKAQQNPDIIWNQLLSWLFIQQRDYSKAFTQERAIFKRAPESLRGILDLARIAIEQDEVETANTILNYVIENVMEPTIVLDAHKDLLEIEVKHALKDDYPSIDEKYKSLLNFYGRNVQTNNLQLSYAKFMAFYNDKPKEAIDFLKETLKTRTSRVQEARVKLLLGDILILQEKFNEALIYYSQIQASLKNSIISQEARFRVAKASYYKGDFKWAESQLKILKSSTSQLIANDALDLKLLISDNKYDDSTQTALKLYAKADLLAFQNKTNEAITKLDVIIANHKTESIMDQALYKQARLFEEIKDYTRAEVNYLAIIENYREDILADDAYYRLAELYSNQLAQPEKAKEFYEKVIFDYADSIFFVEARKKYRALRGDAIN
ncbi:tetratricopeptide repeat protein [Flavobacteriaceae bacterium S0825]|uniref:tetratricopeptide repeat protein n=1 Tax=Gaetbulibacter sp. S0825 TaxID=2720084 RepID=UPI001431406F|nr:tetratricopeptide repeat protein [Gaetbulibacter sp. S0825]MCK0107748.1 tetratricopeptide repeat protein [Flavobacteriaceae bacterium S0825]NIX63384.1 tetratricopeptide repeat protein [Gaetbulibacter sp. S0825]